MKPTTSFSPTVHPESELRPNRTMPKGRAEDCAQCSSSVVSAGATGSVGVVLHDPLREPLVITQVLGVGRIRRRVFVSASEIVEYVASLGPSPVEDLAGGALDPLDPGVMRIPLSSSNQFALIDAEDYPLVMGYRWWLSNFGYAQATHVYGGTSFGMLMHRVVAMVGDETPVVDHKSGDKIDNRKANIRPCTHAENIWNSKLCSRNTSGFKGVSFTGGSWRGTVEANGVVHRKQFEVKEDADAWARAKREELHGEFARHE